VDQPCFGIGFFVVCGQLEMTAQGSAECYALVICCRR
jgi:hypothetical protein